MPDDASIKAQQVIALWPEGPPTVLPDVGPEAAYISAVAGVDTTMLRNVSEATVTVYRPAAGKANGTGIIICPGGGWRILAWQHEGVDLSNWLTERGFTCFLLKYRVQGTTPDAAEFKAQQAALDGRIARPVPAANAPRGMKDLLRGAQAAQDAYAVARDAAADDGRRALAVVRERAAEWGVSPDKVGMIGFSAGAFLVTDVTMDPRGAAPAFVAPIYGGETADRPVPADAPPLFTAVAQGDRMFFKMVEKLYSEWSDADRPAELHIFSKGVHGFGTVPTGSGVDRWTDLFADWLADQGFA